MKKKLLKMILFIFAFCTLIYFVILMLTIGPDFRFNYVWLFMGLFSLGLALTLTLSKKGLDGIPKPLLAVLELLILAGLLLFILVEGLMIRQSVRLPEKEADSLLVLGAKVNGTKPSRILKYRIEKAAEYLMGHPKTRVVVSGGKGEDEGVSEAFAMRTALIQCGIDESRIDMEDKSTSTKENVEFSKQYLDIEKENIVIVTTDFHVLRAVSIAKKAGYQNVEGLAAESVWYLIPTNYVREFLALVKDKLMGNL